MILKILTTSVYQYVADSTQEFDLIYILNINLCL